MSDPKIDSFREKLEKVHAWPSLYMFKFIVPKHKEGEIYGLFPKHETKSKLSKNGRYISITAKIMAKSSDEVINIYQKANKVEGVIAL
jgi:putative lipoic acid-binding regulatory protein